MHLQQLHSTSLYTIILFHHLHDSTLHFNISILGDFPPKKPSTKHPQNLRHLYRPAFSRWTNLKTSSLQKVEIQGHEPWPSRSRLRCHYGSTVPKRPRCHPTDQAGRLAPPNVRHCCFFWGGGIEIGRFQQWFDWEKMIGKDVGCFFWRLVTRCPFHHLFCCLQQKTKFQNLWSDGWRCGFWSETTACKYLHSFGFQVRIRLWTVPYGFNRLRSVYIIQKVAQKNRENWAGRH